MLVAPNDLAIPGSLETRLGGGRENGEGQQRQQRQDGKGLLSFPHLTPLLSVSRFSPETGKVLQNTGLSSTALCDKVITGTRLSRQHAEVAARIGVASQAVTPLSGMGMRFFGDAERVIFQYG